MSRTVVHRDELLKAKLEFGSTTIDLADYATTGLRAVAAGPSGCGKSNVGLVMAEQLTRQGWIAVLVDPEGELASMYGEPVSDPEALREALETREKSIVVVSVTDAKEFLPYGQVILEAADVHRRPIFVVLDEGQLFSSSSRRKNGIGESGDIINQIMQQGRKRRLDCFVTAHRFSGSIHRSVITNKNITFLGTQEDPTAWSALAPMCRTARIEYSDLAALSPGEFYLFARHGVEKVRMPMADALARVAPKARKAKQLLPTTFAAWDRAVRAIPTPRLHVLTPEVTAFLCAVAGLMPQQSQAGYRALADELATRA